MMALAEAPATPQAILLDTSVLINLFRRSQRHIDLIRDLVQSKVALTTSAVNIAEIYSGMRKSEEQFTAEFLSAIGRLPLTPEIAQRAGELTAALRRQGRTHTLDDMVIAATAIEHGYPLLTDNRKDFLVPGLTLFPLA